MFDYNKYKQELRRMKSGADARDIISLVRDCGGVIGQAGSVRGKIVAEVSDESGVFQERVNLGDDTIENTKRVTKKL